VYGPAGTISAAVIVASGSASDLRLSQGLAADIAVASTKEMIMKLPLLPLQPFLPFLPLLIES
jgi:hypothetical protein